MNFVLSHAAFFLLGWFVTIFLLERVKQRFSVPTKLSDGGFYRWLKHLTFALINQLIAPIIMLPIVLWATSLHFWTRPYWMTGVVALVMNIMILDLANYWFHRISHMTPFLWRFHKIHHLDCAFDATTGLRVHFGEVLFQHVFRAIPIIALSISLKSVLIFELILFVGGIFHHSNLCMPKKLEKLLSYIIMTPHTHFVHHHAVVEDTNSNYSFTFIWWDKLFGSFNPAKRKRSWLIGLRTPDPGCLTLLTLPFKFKNIMTPRIQTRDRVKLGDLKIGEIDERKEL